jgi:hypothetical protein
LPDEPQHVIDSLLRDQIKTLEANLNRRLDDTERNLNRRLDKQDADLSEIRKQTKETNGRVTKLEKARERAQGMVFAVRWIPGFLTAGFSAGLTVLIMAISGNLH